MLLQAGVVADGGVLATIAPCDVSNNGGLMVDTSGGQAHGQGLGGIVCSLDNRLGRQRTHRRVQVVETQRGWKYERAGGGGGGGGGCAVDRLAQENSTFLHMRRRGGHFVGAGSGWCELGVPVAVGHQHHRGSEP